MRWLSGLDGVLGGVFGRVASLLENTPKQNEVISETLPEEPDEVKENRHCIRRNREFR